MSKARIIGRNISFLAINQIITIVISFFLFPFIVKSVGKEVYGVYLIVGTITGYFGLFDFGVMSALTKYVSEYNGKGDREGVNRIINASFSFYGLIGIIVALILFTCSIYFYHFFKIDISKIEMAKHLFIVGGLSALFIWPLSTFRGTIQGLNLWNIDAIITIIKQIVTVLAAIFLFSLGYGIVQFFITIQFLMILGYLIAYLVVKNRINFKIVFPYIDLGTFKFMFNFSIFMFLGSLLNMLIFNLHNIIIGHFVSVAAVTVYAVAYNIQNYFRNINSTIGAPPWTIASEMEGRKDFEGQRKLLFKGTKYMSAVFLPIVLIMFFFVEPFINYWMGPSFRESILPARIIILFWLFNGTLELAGGMLSAKGIVRRPLFIQTGIGILNVLISFSLIRVLGINAIAIGLTVSMIVGVPFILRLSLRSLNVRFKEYFNKAIKRNFWLYAFVVVLCPIVLKYFYPVNLYFTLLEMAAIYLVSLGLYYLFNLNKYERSEIIKLIGVENIYNKLFLIKAKFEA